MNEPSPGNAAPVAQFDALWNYEDPAGSEAAFLGILPQVEATGDIGLHAEVLTQIARAQGLQRRFDEGHATLDLCARFNLLGAPRAMVRAMLERGRLWNTAGDTASAGELFTGAWSMARSAGQDDLAVDAAHMLGIVLPGDEGLRWNLSALDLARSSTEPAAQRWQGSLLNNIGWSLHDAGRYEEALATFQEGLAWQEGAGTPRSVHIARWTVARALRSLERYEEALALQEALAETGESDGYVDEEIGECLLALGRADGAREAFARAYALLSTDPWLPADEPERLERLRRLGGIEQVGEDESHG
jgi:tetratricopeptide (TPR) repeat protein